LLGGIFVWLPGLLIYFADVSSIFFFNERSLPAGVNFPYISLSEVFNTISDVYILPNSCGCQILCGKDETGT